MQKALTGLDREYVIPRYATPLRYPGGKARLAPFFISLLQRNRLVDSHYVEPFAGGAGVALSLLRAGAVQTISLNDLDRSIYAFWYAATRRNEAMQRLILRTPVSLAEWDRQKEVQRNKKTASLLELGFSTLYLNRTNRSGILRAGVIGGREQTGEWLIHARFDKHRVVERVAEIRSFAGRISVSQLDAVDFLREQTRRARKRRLAYLDPPYFTKGPDLYLNRLTPAYHSNLADFVQRELSCHWVLTYDNVSRVRTLYQHAPTASFSLDYTADTRRKGRELLITSPSLVVPKLTQRVRRPRGL